VVPRSGLDILETINTSSAPTGICTLNCRANSLVAMPTALLRLPRYKVELLYSGSRCSRIPDNLEVEGNNHRSRNFGWGNFQHARNSMILYHVFWTLVSPLTYCNNFSNPKMTTEGMAGKGNSGHKQFLRILNDS